MLRATGQAIGSADIHVVTFEPSVTVLIEGGENAGQSVTYSNVVTGWRTVARWNGRHAAEFRADVPPDRPLAVIVQRNTVGPVLAAAMLR